MQGVESVSVDSYDMARKKQRFHQVSVHEERAYQKKKTKRERWWFLLSVKQLPLLQVLAYMLTSNFFLILANSKDHQMLRKLITQLPHRACDHKIKLNQGTTAPSEQLNNMFTEELLVLKQFLDENLEKEFI